MLLPYAPWLCWLIPIIGTAVTPLVGAIHRKFSSYLAVFSIGMSALFSFSMIPEILAGNVVDLMIPWLYPELGVLVDPLSVLKVSVITCIGFLVTVFSVAYMQEEPSLARFWFLIQLFIGGYVIILYENIGRIPVAVHIPRVTFIGMARDDIPLDAGPRSKDAGKRVAAGRDVIGVDKHVRLIAVAVQIGADPPFLLAVCNEVSAHRGL